MFHPVDENIEIYVRKEPAGAPGYIERGHGHGHGHGGFFFFFFARRKSCQNNVNYWQQEFNKWYNQAIQKGYYPPFSNPVPTLY